MLILYAIVCMCVCVCVCAGVCTSSYCSRKCTCAILHLNSRVTSSHQISIACFSVQRNGFPQLHCGLLLPGSVAEWTDWKEREGAVKTIGHVSLIGKMEEKMCVCRYVWARTGSTVCLWCRSERETGEVRGCAAAVCVWEGGCKRYPCLLPTCPTLRPLHPGQPGREWGSPGNWTGRGGRGGGSMEARLSATMKRSGIKYKQNLLQYTVSLIWVEQRAEMRSARATVQWVQGGQEGRGEERCS